MNAFFSDVDSNPILNMDKYFIRQKLVAAGRMGECQTFFDDIETFLQKCRTLFGRRPVPGLAEEALAVYDKILAADPLIKEMFGGRMPVVSSAARRAIIMRIDQTTGLAEKMGLTVHLYAKYPEQPVLSYFLALAIDTAQVGAFRKDWHRIPGTKLYMTSKYGDYTMDNRDYQESRALALELLKNVVACSEGEPIICKAASRLHHRMEKEVAFSAGWPTGVDITFSNVHGECNGQMHCEVCGRHTDLVCGRCDKTAYCSVGCQRAGFGAHKASCARCCRACGKIGGALLSCSRCRSAKYCDAACQRRDWGGHSQICAN